MTKSDKSTKKTASSQNEADREAFDFAESLKKMTNEGGDFFHECSSCWKTQPTNRKEKIKKGLLTGLAVLGVIYILKKIFGAKHS